MAEMPTSGRATASNRPRTVEERIDRDYRRQLDEGQRKQRKALAIAEADLVRSVMSLYDAVKLGTDLKLDRNSLEWFFAHAVTHVAMTIANRKNLPHECDHDDLENVLLRAVNHRLAWADRCFGPNWMDAQSCATLMDSLSLGESA